MLHKTSQLPDNWKYRIQYEENYRSVQPLLNLTNIIIEQAWEKYSKILFTRKSGGSRPVLVEARDENDQSVFIVDKIDRICQQGIALNQIAVLFRATCHPFDLEKDLFSSVDPASMPFNNSIEKQTTGHWSDY